MYKRIEDQLRSAALPSSDSAFGVSCATSDLAELLQSFKGSVPPGHILTKGTHFTHTQKFTFTQVGNSAVGDKFSFTKANVGNDGPRTKHMFDMLYLNVNYQQFGSHQGLTLQKKSFYKPY